MQSPLQESGPKRKYCPCIQPAKARFRGFRPSDTLWSGKPSVLWILECSTRKCALQRTLDGAIVQGRQLLFNSLPNLYLGDINAFLHDPINGFQGQRLKFMLYTSFTIFWPTARSRHNWWFLPGWLMVRNPLQDPCFEVLEFLFTK